MNKNGDLDWKNGDVPVSTRFDDIYFSADDGYEESRFVFVERNRLTGPGKMALPQNPALVVGETGFGTGLNFLTLWQILDADARTSDTSLPKLHFQSVELFPLQSTDYRTALLPRDGQLQGRATEFCKALEKANADDKGLFLNLDGGRITLSVWFGDAANRIPDFRDKCHAWFLDGFAPSKNPEMWRQEVFDAMASRSEEGCRLSTFTAAGFVKRGLRQSGFVIGKERGFGRKRDMLTGYYAPEEQPESYTDGQ